MTCKFSPSRLPADMRSALGCIKSCVCAFDRLTIYVDDATLPSSLGVDLKADCRDVKVLAEDNPYHRIWNTKIELYQPTPQALYALHETLGCRNTSKVSYAEIAIDWLTQSRQLASHLGGYLLEHLRVPSARTDIHFEEETAYFNPRSTARGKRTPHVTVLYTDKPSKLLAGKYVLPCCHLEHRVQGHPACSKVGLNTIADCMDFDHVGFWRDALRLCDFESKAALGAILASNPNVSGTALRQRAEAFLKPHRADGHYAGHYVLQNCIKTKPEISKALRRIDNRHFFKSMKLL